MVPAQGDRSPLLDVRHLRIESHLGVRRRTIVRDMEMSVGRGETVGIVGESGSGKSMTARALLGLLPSGVVAQGEVLYKGRDILGLPERDLRRLRGRDLALLFQDPFTMLNPLLKSGRHIEEVLRDEPGNRRTAADRRAEAVRRLSEVGITDAMVAEKYPFQLSGGMRQRVGLAATLAGNCEILIADEPSTALDVTTQKEVLRLLKSIQEARGMGLILITHNLRVAFSICDRIYVLYAGSLLEVAPTAALEAAPLHPYTQGLLLSEPPVGHRLSSLPAMRGSVPTADEVTTMCPFAPRCEWAHEVCTRGNPSLRAVDETRSTACIRIHEIAEDMQRRRQEANALSGSNRAGPAVEDPLIRVEGLSKIYRSDSARQSGGDSIALSSVSLEIARNEVVGLVGESGSGKTTFGRCLVGLETPTAGTITIDGISTSDYALLTNAARQRLRRTIQMIFQDPYSTLNPTLTIGATLREAIAAGGATTGKRDRAVGALLERVGLPANHANHKPRALSGGERQRVAIARALAVNPEILVCDEPVSALDVSVQAQILNLFRSLKTDLGMTFLFITHDLAVARQLVDRLYVLYRGEVVESGPVDTILDTPQHPYTIRLVESIPRAGADWLVKQG